MKTFSKTILGALLVAGTAAAVAAPAEARVGVSVNLGLFAPPPPVVAPGYVLPAYCYGPRYYANCAYPAYGEPVFWNGSWYDHAPYRVIRGRREFFVHGGWHDARAGFREGHRR